MKRLVLSGVAVVFCALWLLGSLAVAQSDDELKPAIVIPKMRHDFGRVYEAETYTYSYPVRNQGKADLLIESVKPG